MSKGGLYFSIDDKLMDEKISLNNVSLPILKDFIEQVSIFIRGNESVDLNGVKIAIKPGSVAIVVEETPLIKTAISEYRIIKSSGDLGKIRTDPGLRHRSRRWRPVAGVRRQDRLSKPSGLPHVP
ncbi:hypothetical protein KOY49_04520 [Candidatus Minimicrobia vallesae]|uniref:Uncharacterized protein n=1 Tax=Candidatus Minimicrobia vallesae TaxID=2841264 RepID=A0A8F1M9M1_9BACT|nr:hypothetical protein [Candidatus Minimicrobia vallesae]QWQ31387.1 hypothetical protein KOY49_04520 [Candidatus Minimicrobia vallesae]